MIRKKRFSLLSKLPGATPRLLDPGRSPPGSQRLLGSVAATLLARALARPGSVRLDLLMFVGPGREPWNPNAPPAAGLSATQSLVWELGRHLASRGHRVRVFGDCAKMEGSFDGVEWLDHAGFADLECDVLLSFGQASVVDPSHDVRARVSLMWLPEVPGAGPLTPARSRQFDAYLAANVSDVRAFRVRNSHIAPQKILQLTPQSLASAATLAEACEEVFARSLYEKRLDIVIFTGPALELWNPDSLQVTGMGGSETMAWEVARHLVALGHRVRVFGHCLGSEGLYEGVEWLDYSRFSGVSCDVLLSSRQPAAVDPIHEVTAKVRLLWVHDVHCGDKLNAERDARTDAYLCLSNWHVACFLQHHTQINPRKVLQIRNGIDLDDYPPGESSLRDPMRAIYSSCPSRGLKIALDAWPTIRREVPGATLHVYYGFENWEYRARRDNDAGELAAAAAIKTRLTNTEGVVFHGRLSPKVLAQHFRLASVWAYPNWFHETSCITAMQAQAAGLKIVTSALAALSETVADRGVLLHEDPHSDAYRTAFTAATIAALRAEPTEQERANLRAYAARHFDLQRLAGDFVAIFRALIERRARAVGAQTLDDSRAN